MKIKQRISILRMVSQYWTLGDHCLFPGLFGALIMWSLSTEEGIVLQLAQSEDTYLVGMSCPGEVGCFEEGVCCARRCNTCMGQCSSPA
jgi:hypothetical protein